MTAEGRAYNLMTFNIGHHAAHHEKPTLHWSLLPARTAKIRPLLDPRTLKTDQATVAVRLTSRAPE